MGSHRVGHDWSDLAAAAACNRKEKKVIKSEKRKIYDNMLVYLEKARAKKFSEWVLTYTSLLKWITV